MNNNSNTSVASVAAQKMTPAQMLEYIQQLEAKVDAKTTRKLSFQISENKGGLLIRTGGKFPKSFYLSEYDKMISQLDELKAFVEKYRAHFAVKDQPWDAKVSLAGLPEAVISRVKPAPAPKA
jgi:hypothetical protein